MTSDLKYTVCRVNKNNRATIDCVNCPNRLEDRKLWCNIQYFKYKIKNIRHKKA